MIMIKIIPVLIILMLNVCGYIYLKRCFNNFKNNKSHKLKHSMKSFQQGIGFNMWMNGGMGIILSIYIPINKFFNNYITEIQNFYWIWYVWIDIVICIVIPHTLYTVTEIKHLSENQNDEVIGIFLKKYVLYGIMSLMFQLVVIYNFKIPSIYLSVSLIFIIMIFMLGMADILNNYEKHLFVEVKNLFDYCKKPTYRTECNKTFIYNIKNIYKGFLLLIFNR